MTDLSKPWPFGLSRRNALFFLAGFAVLIVLLHFLDRPLSAWGTGLPHDVRAVFEWITEWGESGWILIPALVAWLVAWLLSLVTRDNIKRALAEVASVAGFILLGVGLPGLASAILKRVIGRGRPETWTVDNPLSFQWLNWGAYDYQSFPSGHATTAFSLAAVVAFLWPRAFWPAMACAALIAFSRIVVGAHYPTDITAGAVLGVLGAYAVRELFVARGWLFTSSDGRTERRPLAAITGLFRR
ncbi:phosphatase PAP2 family protein [Devosia sp. ZB163]|uniref:phosphatase PAP2 family protein n=1 Tax=Devosia sp. ZB163 TaxID=3025938 RepID=UPI00235EC857|nr:phosphatase PAP2 family protein [Devosia sp. ZB163]MDC9824246.1 phosphatase PAP2 family protein [Devosia sp. ZB163]